MFHRITGSEFEAIRGFCALAELTPFLLQFNAITSTPVDDFTGVPRRQVFFSDGELNTTMIMVKDDAGDRKGKDGWRVEKATIHGLKQEGRQYGMIFIAYYDEDGGDLRLYFYPERWDVRELRPRPYGLDAVLGVSQTRTRMLRADIQNYWIQLMGECQDATLG